jgi:alkyl sulfatase BDS1-like metallo-beta-lactamase superfamily hydrolase
MRKTFVCAALAASLTFGQSPKPATETTRQVNQRAQQEMSFDDGRDFADAQRGRIAPLPDNGFVRDAAGNIVAAAGTFGFLQGPVPDTVNPSLWRQSKLMSTTGLFRVTDRIYQVRGYSISVITFIEGDTGVIVVDPLLSVEPARAAATLYFAHRPKKPVVAVIYTHSHADHYGGVKGVVTEEEVRAGKVHIFAPQGFTEETLSESLLAGNAMTRRAGYMFGTLIPRGPQAMVGDGLDLSMSGGQRSLILPTDVIAGKGETRKIDGLTFEFMNTPGTEAPAEMHFYIVELKALCPAENATHTLHNFYTLRGAKTRDVRKWVEYLDETIDRWGDRGSGKAEVLFAPHHWPVWGAARVVEHLEKYRDTVKYIHDQTLRLANQGYNMEAIAEQLALPPSLAQNSASQGYYGTVSHNAKAVYNFYLGYFDGNPAHLNPLPEVEAAKKYVEFMGGADEVLRKAGAAYEHGEYRWVAEVVNHVVFAFPDNARARQLQADALEQLGYQAESGPWRNFYLTGAQELRAGVRRSAANPGNAADVMRAMPIDLFLDYVAIQLNGPKATGKILRVGLSFSDTGEHHLVSVDNAVLNHWKNRPGADCTVTLDRSQFFAMLADHSKAADVRVEGRREVLQEFLALLEPFDSWFNIVTP